MVMAGNDVLVSDTPLQHALWARRLNCTPGWNPTELLLGRGNLYASRKGKHH